MNAVATRPGARRQVMLRLPGVVRGPDDPPWPGLRPDPLRCLMLDVPADLYVPRVLQRQGLAHYEPETLSCFLALLSLQPEAPVFDVGANVGVFALLATALTNARVTAFEPAPDLAATARRIAADNGLAVRVEERALGDQNGTATLYLSAVTDSSNSLRAGFRPARDAIEVPLTTLDLYCADPGPVPSLVKLDTETTEPSILRGAVELLARHRPHVLCEVLAGRTEAELDELLHGSGYHLYPIRDELPLRVAERVTGDREHRFNNWLFAPSPPPEALWSAMRAWRSALARCEPRSADECERRPLDLPGLAFATGDPGTLAPRWRPQRENPHCVLVATSREQVTALCQLGEGERYYLTHGATRFEHTPADADDWRIGGGQRLEVSVEMEVLEGSAEVQLWAIEYGGGERLQHASRPLAPGTNRLELWTSPATAHLRLAFRFSGRGTCRLGPVWVDLLEETSGDS